MAGSVFKTTLALWLALGAWADPAPGNLNVGADGDAAIVVHLVPHSHIDAGWLVNFDEYQLSQVDTIFDNVLLQLEQDSRRTFALGEIAFFSSWYQRQPPGIRARFRKLADSRQIEFVNGGWVQHDEACPLYGDMLDQTTRGHQFLLSEFNQRPTTTWQLDPFGHSSTSSWLLGKEAGFKALFYARSSFEERIKRLANKTLEFQWQGVANQQGIPTSLLFGTGQTSGSFYHSFFNFENTEAKSRNYIVDEPCFQSLNVDSWVERVIVAARVQQSYSVSKHILWMMGDDFTFQSASRWYSAFDKLINHTNADPRGMRLMYSTPSVYLAASGLLSTKNSRQGDMFPLVEDRHAVWSGYFTSRPALKRQHRAAAALLRSSRQIEVLQRSLHGASSLVMNLSESRVRPSPPVGVGFTDDLEGAVALATHHDAITGTSRESVALDYAWRLSLGAQRANQGVLRVLSQVAGFPLGRSDGTQDGSALMCDCNSGVMDCLNASTCSITSRREDFTVLLWNSLAHNRSVWVDLPVSLEGMAVLDHRGEPVLSTVTPLDPSTLALPEASLNSFGLSLDDWKIAKSKLTNPARFRLSFLASDLPALGYSTFRVNYLPSQPAPDSAAAQQPAPLLVKSARLLSVAPPMRNSISNDEYRLSFDPRSGQVTGLTNLISGVKTALSIVIGSYRPSTGDADSKQSSGAYIFRPAQEQNLFEVPADFRVLVDDAMSEIRLSFRGGGGGGGGSDGGGGDDSAFLGEEARVDVTRHPTRRTARPSHKPTRHPVSARPSSTAHPTRKPVVPTHRPSFKPSLHPTHLPSSRPSNHPTKTHRPTRFPSTHHPSKAPTATMTSAVDLVLRLRKGLGALEVDYLVGPLKHTGFGEELFLRYITDLESGREFETDANARESMRRTFNGSQSEPLAANMYPVNTFISISDDFTPQRTFAVVTEVTQGGTSSRSGRIELLLHRRLFADDSRGMGEPLNETMCGCGDLKAAPGETGAHGHLGDGGCECKGLIIRGVHRLVLDHPRRAKWTRRQVALAANNPPLAVFFKGYANKPRGEGLLLRAELPRHVDLVTLSANYPRCGVLVRLAHLLSASETTGNNSVVVQVGTALKGLLVNGARLIPQSSATANADATVAADSSSVETVVLNPMDVRTFCIRP